MHDVKRTWTEINLQNAADNYYELKRITGGAKLIAVIKANAYGHGAVTLARLYESLGADYLAVACLSEALALRDNGITLPILILGSTPVKYIAEVIKNNITQTVYSAEYAKEVSNAAKAAGGICKIHIKADTGMTRIGFRAHRGETEQAVAAIKEVTELKNLSAEGIFTHFADAENFKQAFTEEQFNAFTDLVSQLKNSGVDFTYIHCANSAAVLHYRKAHLNCVRAGLALYGLYPDGIRVEDVMLKPVMSVKSTICEIRILKPGDTVSYGRTFTAEREMRAAVVTAGYADGIRRSLSNTGAFLVHGIRAALLGKVCMDMCIIDISDIPEVKIGDTVTIFGEDNGAVLPLDELADICQTITYELCCSVSERVERVYLNVDCFNTKPVPNE